MSTSSTPAAAGNNTTNDEAAELLADLTYLQALEDGTLARTVRLRAGVLERQVTEGDNEFALTMTQSIRRALWEVEHRARTGAPSRRVGRSEEGPQKFSFDISIQDGALFVGELLAFKPGRYLQIGKLEILSVREQSDREDYLTNLGRDAGRWEALGSAR